MTSVIRTVTNEPGRRWGVIHNTPSLTRSGHPQFSYRLSTQGGTLLLPTSHLLIVEMVPNNVDGPGFRPYRRMCIEMKCAQR